MEQDSHSEIRALNKALWDRQRKGIPIKEDLSESLLYNRKTKDTFNKTKEGNEVVGGVHPRCLNCRALTKGVIVIGNDKKIINLEI